MTATLQSFDFRRILGHYPTGVCAVTTMFGEKPIGMAIGSFTSVSLDPPLVGFLPDRKSESWPQIEASGRFCINVLSEHQLDVCRVMASKEPNKFENVPYRLSGAGLPIVEGVVAWIDCDLYAVHEAGDHYIALGQVHSMDIEHPHWPLLFYKGGYGKFSPLEMPAA